MPETKKYLNRDGLEEYNSLLPHSSGEMQEYVNDWLDEHPEATTTVQDGAITEPKLADKSVSLRTLADDTMHMLKGMILTREISGDILTADDAYAAPPVSLDIAGKSTQDGTPTPETPVEIVSLEQVNLTFAGKNIINQETDSSAYEPYSVTNVLLNLTHALRSLPDGTHDTLSLTYLRPSTREGWAWYSGEVVERTSKISLAVSNMIDEDHGGIVPGWTGINTTDYSTSASAAFRHTSGECNIHSSSNGDAYAARYNSHNFLALRPEYGYPYSTAEEWKSAHPDLVFTMTYRRRKNAIVTTDLDPIELPVLPAPNCTVWSDPSTGLRMRYMRDSNIVIQRIEEAIADQ